MLQIVLLAGKFVFLLILYLFIYYVVRSAVRELGAAAPAPPRRDWMSPAAQERTPAYASTASAATWEREAVRGRGTWTLVVERSPCLAQGAAIRLPLGTRALVGRSPEMDVHLEDTFVSSKHALFESTGQGLVVEDLRSTNGTQVNGEDIAGPRLLENGDRVEVGDTMFRVEVQ